MKAVRAIAGAWQYSSSLWPTQSGLFFKDEEEPLCASKMRDAQMVVEYLVYSSDPDFRNKLLVKLR